MKYNIFLTTAMLTALAASCAIEEAQSPEAADGKMTIHADISGSQTRSYIAADGRTVYWSQGDALGVYTEEGSKNAVFTAETADNAYNGDFIGSLVDETPKYAYHPYCNQSGDYTAVELFLSDEQSAESISAYNFMGSNSFIKAGTNNYAMEFRSVLSILEVRIDATDTPLANSALSSITVQALPLNEGDAIPAVTGELKMDLTDISTLFEGNTYDYAKLVWATPHEFSEGVTSAYMFVNPEAFKKGMPVNITIETEDGATATVQVSAAKDFQPHTRYDFNLSLTNLADKVIYEGNPIASLSFTQEANAGKLLGTSAKNEMYYEGTHYYYTTKSVYNDIECTYDESEGVWTAVIPYLYDFSGLVASFTTVEEGAAVYVGDVEQVSGETANDFNDVVTYVVESASGVRQAAKVKLVNSGLPVVTITGTVYEKDEEFVKASSVLNVNGTDYSCGVRLRGNSTQLMPKKPYAIKLDDGAEILGMPKHKRWVLLANWIDRTMLRNDLSFYLAQQTDSWAPHGEPVEVVLNGVHVGNYFLCEQIKIDENRVNIADVKCAGYTTQTDVAANVGFLLECDSAPDEDNQFSVTSPVRFGVNIKDPGDCTSSTAAYSYIRSYFNTVGTALRNSDWTTAAEYLDYKTWVDHWLFTELTENQESKHPKSFYMYKDAGGKLCAGPAWDYDWGTFMDMSTITDNSSTAGSIKDKYTMRYTMWYQYLFNDPSFVSLVKERWAVLKPKFDTSLQYLDKQAARLAISDTFNFPMWPLDGVRFSGGALPNLDETLSFDDAIAQMRDALEARIEWLDVEISNM